MSLLRRNGKILGNDVPVLGGTQKITFIGTSNTFPFSVVTLDNYGITSFLNLIEFTDTDPVQVTIDYGDGTVVTGYSIPGASPVSTAYTNTFIIHANTAWLESTLADYHQIYTYPDGEVKERKVQISFDYSRLEKWIGMPYGTVATGVFNLQMYRSVNLSQVSFANAANTVYDFIYLDRITSTSNPKLKVFDLQCFSEDSPYYSQIPLNILNLPLTTFTCGNSGYTPTGSNLEYLGTYPIKDTLATLTFAEGITDQITYDLFPESLGQLSKLTSLTFSNNVPIKGFPAFLGELSNLVSLRFGTGTNTMTEEEFDATSSVLSTLTKMTTFQPIMSNMTTTPATMNTNLPQSITSLNLLVTTYLTSMQDFSNLVNLSYIQIYGRWVFGNFPDFFDSFTKLASIYSTDATNRTTAYVTSKIDAIYDLIVRNASMTEGSTPFRNLIVNLNYNGTTTAIDGAIEAPADYVQGSSNGTPANPGQELYVLIYQYGTSVVYNT